MFFMPPMVYFVDVSRVDSMNAELLSIGDELLIGQVINSNAAWLGDTLASLGIPVRRVTSVGDDHPRIQTAFARAWSEHEVVIVTGGLGPTHDDITRAAIVDFFGTHLVHHPDALANIEAMFVRLGRTLTDVHRDQAMIPACAVAIPNTEGTAPGFHIAREGRHFFALPGVPYEMKAMVESYIVPVLEAAADEVIVRRTLLSTGIPESTLAERLAGIETLLDTASLAYLPSATGVRMRVSAHDADGAIATARVEAVVDFIRTRVGDYLFGEGTSTLEAEVGAMLRTRGMSIAVAESCTGGLIASLLTDVPGSSDYLLSAAVTYSNESKTRMLGVDPDLIERYGAVSEQVALAMADGMRRAAGSSVAVASTGIAGPTGGSDLKPVGLVWLALAAEDHLEARRFLFGTNRTRTKLRASIAALDLVRRHLAGLPF